MITPHLESQETREFIADWIDPNFFYSKKDVWHRFGMLGVFGDYVLSCTPGAIGEIGVGESSIYLTHLARKWGRYSYHCDIAPGKIVNPLTIPGYLFKEPVNVEPAFRGGWVNEDNVSFFIGPSDSYFTQLNPAIHFALSFVDGDHNYAQVKKDFYNFAERTVDNGYIILHDTYPPSEEYTNENRCGTVFLLRQDLEQDPRFDCITLPLGCAIGVGLTIVRVKPRGALPVYQQ